MRACIMYIWKIFDEILKEIVKLEKNVLKKTRAYFLPIIGVSHRTSCRIDPIDSLILHTENITSYKKLSLILSTLSVERTNRFRFSLPDLCEKRILTSETNCSTINDIFFDHIMGKGSNEHYSYNTIYIVI